MHEFQILEIIKRPLGTITAGPFLFYDAVMANHLCRGATVVHVRRSMTVSQENTFARISIPGNGIKIDSGAREDGKLTGS